MGDSGYFSDCDTYSYKKFYLYLYVYIAATVISNIYISKKTDKLFPYVNDKDVQKLDTQKNQIL